MARNTTLAAICAMMLGALAAMAALPALSQTTTIRYALGDVISIDELPLLIAVENARKRGVDVQITAFKSEELATQAVINGQADIGQGTPYAAVQKVTTPIRFFYQLSALQFFPVVEAARYPAWKDLDGQDIVVHARGSGTEAIMQLMAKEHNIKYKSVSYVPGSNVRALGLIKGNIKATILDANNMNLVMREAPGKFKILRTGRVQASDEALFASQQFLESKRAAVAVLVEELVKVNRAINRSPDFVVTERKRLGLLKDLPEKLEPDILPFFTGGAKDGIFPDDGGGSRAAQNDLDFFKLSGALTGDNLKVADFWDLRPLQAALANVK